MEQDTEYIYFIIVDATKLRNKYLKNWEANTLKSRIYA